MSKIENAVKELEAPIDDMLLEVPEALSEIISDEDQVEEVTAFITVLSTQSLRNTLEVLEDNKLLTEGAYAGLSESLFSDLDS